MEKMNFVRDGGRKLPPGFRFQPTEEEIVFQYLSSKIFSHQLPALVIPELDVFTLDPWLLPDESSEQDMYFFMNNSSSSNGWEEQEVTPSGFWKLQTHSSKHINSSQAQGMPLPILGIRNSLVFYKYYNPRAVRTPWKMHRYSIALSQHNSQNNNSLVRIGEWSLCHIFMLKKGGSTTIEADILSSSASSSSSPNTADPNVFSDVSS